MELQIKFEHVLYSAVELVEHETFHVIVHIIQIPWHFIVAMDVTKSLFPSSVELLRYILVWIIHLRDRRPSKHEFRCTSLYKINHILLSEKSSNPFLPVDR